VLEENVSKLLEKLRPSDVVLDVGGWACPFNRAQWIIDGQPYETRGFYRTFGGKPFQGPAEEWFTRDTWVTRDLCDRERWPFRDKQFDFVICSQTLEDLRDPLWVCSELMRVGKAGYVEVPSRLYESCRGVEHPSQAGLSHHRWLVEIHGKHVTFLQKYHMIHRDWRLSLPASYRHRLTNENANAWLWWTDSFTVEEIQIHGLAEQEAALRAFIDSIAPPPQWMLLTDSAWRALSGFSRRGVAWAERRLRRSL
jgi:hypothetical protein